MQSDVDEPDNRQVGLDLTDGDLFTNATGPAALRFFDLTQVASEILRNVSFTREWIHAGEDRVVLLFDRAQVLQGIGIDKETDELPTT